MNYVTFLPARGVGTAVPEPSCKASAGMEAHAANTTSRIGGFLGALILQP